MNAMSQLVTCLLNVVRHNMTSATSQSTTVCQLALIGLQLLCRLLAGHRPQLFTARDSHSVSSAIAWASPLATFKHFTSCPVLAWQLICSLSWSVEQSNLCTSTPCPKNVHLLFFELLCQKLTDLMVFGVLNPEKIWHENLTSLSTSFVRCSYFTLGNPKSHFQLYYSNMHLITYIISEENKL